MVSTCVLLEKSFSKRIKERRKLSYVTRYDKIDHLQFFMKFAFWVWVDAEFTVEFNGQRPRLKKVS